MVLPSSRLSSVVRHFDPRLSGMLIVLCRSTRQRRVDPRFATIDSLTCDIAYSRRLPYSIHRRRQYRQPSPTSGTLTSPCHDNPPLCHVPHRGCFSSNTARPRVAPRSLHIHDLLARILLPCGMYNKFRCYRWTMADVLISLATGRDFPVPRPRAHRLPVEAQPRPRYVCATYPLRVGRPRGTASACHLF